VIFVDSSFWIAQALRRDSHHAAARRLSMQFGTVPLVTSNLVQAETWTYLRRRTWHGFALSWLDSVSVYLHSVKRIDPALEDEAWAWLRLHDERPYSFVDATSFALMRKLRITDALAFDGDFAAAGFTELST
jgi:predicted nucleic acid-binding protein